ncbi:uncharacterized protein J3D65DRAFT_693766 [Phyllosticta citribraziliensis]|uniref:Uncharacterized protein n=1 Tax=Phyllosticta citribraziliensis TaxID=989973 RepID=A0ABR1LXP4_9PEZI
MKLPKDGESPNWVRTAGPVFARGLEALTSHFDLGSVKDIVKLAPNAYIWLACLFAPNGKGLVKAVTLASLGGLTPEQKYAADNFNSEKHGSTAALFSQRHNAVTFDVKPQEPSTCPFGGLSGLAETTVFQWYGWPSLGASDEAIGALKAWLKEEYNAHLNMLHDAANSAPQRRGQWLLQQISDSLDFSGFKPVEGKGMLHHVDGVGEYLDHLSMDKGMLHRVHVYGEYLDHLSMAYARNTIRASSHLVGKGILHHVSGYGEYLDHLNVEKGMLHHVHGYGEYLDHLSMAYARNTVRASSVPSDSFSVKTLRLGNFVVDSTLSWPSFLTKTAISSPPRPPKTTMSSPSGPRLTEEEQRQFANFSEVIRSSPPLTAEEQRHFVGFSTDITRNLERWPAWERLQRRMALSEEGAMALGLIPALPDHTNADIVELVLRAAQGALTEGEEGALLNLVKSVCDDGQSDHAGPDNMITEDEDEPLSEEEEEEEEEEDEDEDDDEDDDDDDNDDEEGDKPKQEVRSSGSAR